MALSQRDRDRLKELHAVIRRRQKLSQAARHLKLSRRQTRRLVRRVQREGDRGVLHRLRGRPSDRRRRSLRTSRAALAPGPPVTPPPGWVLAPQR